MRCTHAYYSHIQSLYYIYRLLPKSVNPHIVKTKLTTEPSIKKGISLISGTHIHY